MVKQYGITEVRQVTNELERHTENIKLKGYTFLRSILTEEQCIIINKKAEYIYQLQLKEFGQDNIKLTNEEDVVRCPLYYDEYFIQLIVQPRILEIISALLKNQFILHLQNIIINRPNKEHHQTSWHRDIPYQEYTLSQPIAINVFYCTSPFSAITGATRLLPYSHLFEKFPSLNYAEENSIYIEANPGDVCIFDSWLYHRATENVSEWIRYGVNHVYTVPMIKQQIDLPAFLNGKYSENELLSTLLGYTFEPSKSVQEFRANRLKRVKKK